MPMTASIIGGFLKRSGVDRTSKFCGIRASSYPVGRTVYLFDSLLFHSDGLREVSGLVYVAASSYGYVVGEELEGDYFEDGE